MSVTFGIKRTVELFQSTVCDGIQTQGIPASRGTLGFGV